MMIKWFQTMRLVIGMLQIDQADSALKYLNMKKIGMEEIMIGAFLS